MLTDCRIPISRDKYKSGFSIFGFNFAADHSDGCGMMGYINETRTGSMRIEIHFAKKLTEAINIILFCEFDNLVMIPQDRNAIADYH